MSAARLSIQPNQHNLQQPAGTDCPRRVDTVPMTLELLPQAATNGNAPVARDDPSLSPRRPDLVKFTIQVDSGV